MKTGFGHKVTLSEELGLNAREKAIFENALDLRADKRKEEFAQVFKTFLKINAKRQQAIDRIIGKDKIERIKKFQKTQEPVVVHLMGKSGISPNAVKRASRKVEKEWAIFSRDLKIAKKALSNVNEKYLQNIKKEFASLYAIRSHETETPVNFVRHQPDIRNYKPPFFNSEIFYNWTTKGDNIAFTRQIDYANSNIGRMVTSMALEGKYEDVDQQWASTSVISMHLAHLEKTPGKVKITATFTNEYGRIYHAGHSGATIPEIVGGYWGQIIIQSRVSASIRFRRWLDFENSWKEECEAVIKIAHTAGYNSDAFYDEPIIPKAFDPSIPLTCTISMVSQTTFTPTRSLWIEISLNNLNWGMITNFDNVHVDFESYWKLSNVEVENL